jgi:hypothetical protein
MKLRVTCALFLPLLAVDLSSKLVKALSPLVSSPSRNRIVSSFSDTALQVGVAWNLVDHGEEDYSNVASSDFIMHRAQVCADSDSCSLEVSQTCLDELLHVQVQCIGSGVLSTSAVCNVENVDSVADVVAKLRYRIQEESRRLVWIKAGMNVANTILGVFIGSMILHGLAADPNVPVDSMTSALVEFDPNRGVVPFLPIEWLWAARDGYLPLMVSQWLQHGGLVVDSSTYDVKAVPFTPQEWIWAIQNGSFGHLLKENMMYGALRVDASYNSETIPLEFKELWWALNGGYLDDVVRHFFRNGGL